LYKPFISRTPQLPHNIYTFRIALLKNILKMKSGQKA